MRNIWTIANREYKWYFSNPTAYLIAFIILLVLGIFFYLNLQVSSMQQGFVPGVEVILYPMGTLLLFVTPAITTRMLAEEQRIGTIELLLTAPVRDWELVVGKWLGGLLLLLTIIAITLIFPLFLNQIVTPGIDQGPVLTGYLGMILLCSSLIAVGVAISSFFSNQIAAFVTTLGVLVLLWWVIGPIGQVMGPAVGVSELISYLDYPKHFYDSLVRGIVDLRDIVYYLSVTAIGLFIATVSVEMRRWR
jgi:ABC-2 type transport system permease protein